MHHVYTGTFANTIYVGKTKNLTKRLYVHKSRYRGTVDGSDYFCYVVWRSITESFDDIIWKIEKSFNNEKLAKEYEISLIKKMGNLNEQYSELSQREKFNLYAESLKYND